MKIMDERYGAESVTQKGKVYTYDSGECLLNYLRKARPEDEYYSYLLVTDFLEPGTLIDAHQAYFLVSPNMPSPMGGDLNAFQSKEQAENLLVKNGGKLFSWSEISEDYSFDPDL
jgi:copper chaperone NosL